MEMEGNILPEWEVLALDGSRPPAIGSLRGQPVLFLFFSIRCPGCKSRALPYSRALAEEYPFLRIIGIHTHIGGPDYSLEQIREIARVHKLPYLVVKDQGTRTYELFGAEGTPHWVLMNPQGKVLKSMFGSMPNTLQRLDMTFREMDG